MCCVGHIQHHSQSTLDASHVVGSKLAQLISCRTFVHIHLSYQVSQFARVNLHGARCRTQSVGGASLVAIVLVLFL